MGKGEHQGCILSPCLFKLYAEYIMQNAGLDEAQAGIKIARRNSNNLRYADDTTLMAESEEELKSLLMQVKEKSEKVGLKLNISFSNESTLRMRWPKYWSFSFSIIPSKEIPGPISFRMDWLDLLAVPRDSQESSPTPQFKSINSSALSFLHSPTLTSIHDHWKNCSFDWMDLCWKSNVSSF